MLLWHREANHAPPAHPPEQMTAQSLAAFLDTSDRETPAAAESRPCLGNASTGTPDVVSMLDKKYGPSSLVVRSIAVCLFNGMTASEIASELNLTVEEVKAVSEAPATKARLRHLLVSADPVRLTNMLKAAAIDAVLAQRELIGSQDPAIRYKAAAYIIDRTLGAKTVSKRGLENHELEDPETASRELQKQIEEAKRQLNMKNL